VIRAGFVAHLLFVALMIYSLLDVALMPYFVLFEMVLLLEKKCNIPLVLFEMVLFVMMLLLDLSRCNPAALHRAEGRRRYTHAYRDCTSLSNCEGTEGAAPYLCSDLYHIRLSAELLRQLSVSHQLRATTDYRPLDY